MDKNESKIGGQTRVMQQVILNKTLCKKYFHSGKTVKESVAINNSITNYNKTTIHNWYSRIIYDSRIIHFIEGGIPLVCNKKIKMTKVS